MSIEIEARGIRWRSMGRPISVETPADRRLQSARASLAHGQMLRPVLQTRRHQPASAAVQDDSTGAGESNLRPGCLDEAIYLDAKD